VSQQEEGERNVIEYFGVDGIAATTETPTPGEQAQRNLELEKLIVYLQKLRTQEVNCRQFIDSQRSILADAEAVLSNVCALRIVTAARIGELVV
jgi:hypothetical protein